MVQKNIQWAAVLCVKMICWCQRWMARLVWVDRKATVTVISYNRAMQKSISECTTLQTLKQMGYSSRRQWVPLLSANNRKLKLQFTQAHQNWTIEDWKKVAWSDEPRFLLRHLDVWVRIWHKQHESMDPSCLRSTAQVAAAGVMVLEIFPWHILGLLVPTEHHLNATTWVLLLTISIRLWTQCTHLVMATSSRIMGHITKLHSQ